MSPLEGPLPCDAVVDIPGQDAPPSPEPAAAPHPGAEILPATPEPEAQRRPRVAALQPVHPPTKRTFRRWSKHREQVRVAYSS